MPSLSCPHPRLTCHLFIHYQLSFFPFRVPLVCFLFIPFISCPLPLSNICTVSSLSHSKSASPHPPPPNQPSIKEQKETKTTYTRYLPLLWHRLLAPQRIYNPPLQFKIENRKKKYTVQWNVPLFNMCYQLVELYSACRCLYYQHAVDRCAAYGRPGHGVTRRTILVGYACQDHSQHGSYSSYSAPQTYSDSGYHSGHSHKSSRRHHR